MSLVVVGLNHQTSSIELREQLHFDDDAIPAGLHQLHKQLGDGGGVILSTCNRVEVYAHGEESAEELFALVQTFVSEWHDVPVDTFRAELYEYADKAAVGHLFRVASSLDSLVVGEAQILGQVHGAYLKAQTEQATDKVIRSLFQRSFSVAKEVRTRTTISEGKVSVASVAVDLAVSIFMSLKGKTVMVIGSGEMGQQTLKSLVGHGVGRTLVVNRSVEKAQELAKAYNGEAIALDDLENHLHRADILISSTSADTYVLGPDDFSEALKKRSKEPMFVIDIAAPRDVDPAVNDIDDIYLYDMDSLKSVVDKNLEARRKELDACLKIVDKGVEQFWRWMQGLIAEPTIVSMTAELDGIRERELEKTLKSLPDLTDKQREEVTYLSKRIVKTILQRPMRQIKQEVTDSDPNIVLHLVKRLFGLKEVT